jgi:polysaccharide deacetylase family sporulation protein PdaB
MDEVTVMNFFYVIRWKQIRNISIIILTSLAAAMFLYLNTGAMETFLTKDGPKAIYKGKRGVSLTFDILWGENQAVHILEQLKKEKVTSATFFLSGSWAEGHSHIVEKIVEAGYEIGLLGYEYKDYSEIDDAAIKKDILKGLEVFEKLDVPYKKYLRAPTGHFDKRLLSIANNLGFTVVHWSINTNDWKSPGTGPIINSVKDAENGDIILLHASDSAKQTAKALPGILKELQKKNLKLTTVSENLVEGKWDTREIH